MNETRFVVKPGENGGQRVERAVRWQTVGAAEPEPTAEELRDDLMFALRDQGLGPEPVLSYSTGDAGERLTHIDWPDLGTHALDADYARLLAVASLPLFRECPELDNSPERDPDLEAEIEEGVQEIRAERFAERARASVAAFADYVGRLERRLGRRPKRKQSPPPDAKPSPRVIFDGVRDEHGWHWTKLVPGPRPRRARARIRPPRDGR